MGRICPWWLGCLLANPVRRWAQDPAAVLRPHVADGMTALEPGPGVGYFTLELARLVGAGGRVVAVDVQPRMLASLRHRAERAGLAARIETRLARSDSLGVEGLAGRVDFVLAFAVVHELPDAGRFFAEARRALRPGGRLFLAEPSLHVRAAEFASTFHAAERAGLVAIGAPRVRWSRTALFQAPS
ncbi:MAG TPA: methyltransferase domain-containing protein [Anaeromyxobacteraceae bacterium]|nr:methyltransferase domain-containing protein [Anaeromyxobacteraceae bacterium]